MSLTGAGSHPVPAHARIHCMSNGSCVHEVTCLAEVHPLEAGMYLCMHSCKAGPCGSHNELQFPPAVWISHTAQVVGSAAGAVISVLFVCQVEFANLSRILFPARWSISSQSHHSLKLYSRCMKNRPVCCSLPIPR